MFLLVVFVIRVFVFVGGVVVLVEELEVVFLVGFCLIGVFWVVSCLVVCFGLVGFGWVLIFWGFEVMGICFVLGFGIFFLIVGVFLIGLDFLVGFFFEGLLMLILFFLGLID